jgi:hypothetical protein
LVGAFSVVAVLPAPRGETVLLDFFGVFAMSRSPWSPAVLFYSCVDSGRIVRCHLV